jgi:integrase
MTLEELFSAYVTEYGKIHKRTWKNDMSTYNRHLYGLRLRKISEITKDDLTKLHRRIGHQTPITANRVIELISSVYNWARNEKNWEGTNPTTGIKPFKERRRSRFLDADELSRFLVAVAAVPKATVRDYFIVSLFAGARKDNVLSMQWSEVKWERSVWEIPAHKSKNKEILTVPLMPIVLDVLARRRDTPDADPQFVFPGRGKTGHLVDPAHPWKRLLACAGITDFRIHDMRRTYGSWQAMQGVSLPIIGASLGHRSLTATQIYARLHMDSVHAGVQRGTEAMLAQLPDGVKLLPAVKDGGRE